MSSLPLRPLTRRQEEILTLIESRSIPPTIRDLCRDLGVSSPSGVHQQLKAMERKGAIERDPFAARAIRSTRLPVKLPLAPPKSPRVSLPISGIVTPAGRVDWTNPPVRF